MAEEFLVAVPEYWKHPMKPRGFMEFCDMIASDGKIKGIWEWVQWNAKTGEPVKREWNMNVVTDAGANNILASAIASASNANPWNNILITNNSGSTTLTGSGFTEGQSSIISLPCASLPAAIPANYPAPANAIATQLSLGYGTPTPQSPAVTVNGSAAYQAVSIPVNSFTAHNATTGTGWPTGTNIVPLPNVQENPSNTNLTANANTARSSYSGNLSSGAFNYTPTTGAGNRQVVVTFTFKDSTNGGSTLDASYTDAWLVNVNSGATNTTTGNFIGNYIAHEINTPMLVD